MSDNQGFLEEGKIKIHIQVKSQCLVFVNAVSLTDNFILAPASARTVRAPKESNA